MAEKKVVGRLVNTVSFQTDRASLQKALADIKKVKDAMKGLVVPANAMRKQAAAMKQQIAAKRQLVNQDKDWLVVQRAINKNKIKEEQREKRILDSKAKGAKIAERQAKAALKQQRENEARWDKALAQYTKRRDDVLSRRDSQRIRRRINRSNSLESLHGQALGMNAAYDRRQARVHSRALAENAKRDRVASQNTANSASRRKDMFAADRFNLSNRFGNAGNRRFDEIASRYTGATSSLRMYRQEVSALRRNLTGAANAQRGFNGTMKDMRSMFVQATASYTAFAGLTGIAETGKRFQGYESAMTMGFGGEEKAAPMKEYLQKEIRRLGLDQQSTTEDFSKYSVSANKKLTPVELKEFFSSFMEYASVAGAGKEKTSLGFRAVGQMLDKNQIMAEEFNSRLNMQ